MVEMSIRSYFQPENGLPDTKGSLSCIRGQHIYGILVLEWFCSARGIPTTWWIDTLFFARDASLSCL